MKYKKHLQAEIKGEYLIFVSCINIFMFYGNFEFITINKKNYKMKQSYVQSLKAISRT